MKRFLTAILILTPLAPAFALTTFTNNEPQVSVRGKLNATILTVETNTLRRYEDAYVVAKRGDTDAQSYTNLVAAYTAAAALAPGGNSLSSSNRAAVIIPPGGYYTGTNNPFNLTADYVDLIALVPETPRHPDTPFSDLINFDPPNAYIYGYGTNVLNQYATDIKMVGFGVCNFGAGDGVNDGRAFKLWDNYGATNSYYEKLYFYEKPGRSTWGSNPDFSQDVGGFWIDCVGSDRQWRVGWDEVPPYTGYFKATMINCHAGDYSFGGDAGNASQLGDRTFKGAYLEGCSAGDGAFGGCTAFGIPSDAGTVFKNCHSGQGSFGLGVTNNYMTLIDCTGGDGCVGGSWQGPIGAFHGTAINCEFGSSSFGSQPNGYDPYIVGYDTYGYGLYGTLINCRFTSSVNALICKGATIKDCEIEVSNSGKYGVVLMDSDTKIYDTMIKTSNGTGIDANSPVSVYMDGVSFDTGTASHTDEFIVNTYTSPQYMINAGATATNNGSTLVYVAGLVNTYNAGANAETPEIILGDGTYTLSAALSITSPVSLVAENPPDPPGESIAGITNMAWSSIITGGDLLVEIDGETNGLFRLDGVEVSDGITSANTATRMYITRSKIGGGADDLACNGRATIMDSWITKGLTCPYPTAYNVYVSGGSWSLNNITGSGVFRRLWWNSEALSAFPSVTRSGWSCNVEDSKFINGAVGSLFLGTADGDVEARDVDFSFIQGGGGASWNISTNSIFINCFGIGTNVSGTAGIVYIGCLDETGARITDAP